MSRIYIPGDKAVRESYIEEIQQERARLKDAFVATENMFFKMRRAVVFRPSAPEPLDVGAEKDLALHVVHGDGTTSAIDDFSRVTAVIAGGEGAVLTPQPVTFTDGVAVVRVKKTGAGILGVGLIGYDAAGTPLEVPMDISAVKILT